LGRNETDIFIQRFINIASIMSKDFIKKTMEELDRLDQNAAKNSSHFPIWILLDDVRSMNNVGSVFRTADSFNVSGIYLCGFTPQPPHRDIHKTALGATESVNWKYEQDITIAIESLKQEGYKIFGIEQTHNSIWLQDMHLHTHSQTAFIFGNEVTGVSDKALALCDGVIEIPQFGSKHSLNIAITTGIVVWEYVSKQILRDKCS
jgi:23S rRNA (guanosine2251-2'-O)-methyltransferase